MAIGVRWRKVRGDLGQYRARTALVVASIAIGVFAVGTTTGAEALLRRNLEEGFAATRPAAATVFTGMGFDRELVDVIRGMPGVDDAEGRRSVVVRLLADDGTSREMLLTALPAFEDQRIDLVRRQTGTFPPAEGEVAFERSALRIVDVAAGQTIRIRAPGGKEHDLAVAGLAHEPGASPAYYFGRLNAYVTFETLEDLGWDDSFNEVRIRLDNPAATVAEASAIADEVRLRIEKAGVPVAFSLVPEPGKHPANELLAAVFVVLGGIGFLSLLMAGFLVANTVSVIIGQQVRQVGIMKAIGARDRQVAGIYLALVVRYGLLALLIAIPLAALAAYGLASLASGLLNFDVTHALVPPEIDRTRGRRGRRDPDRRRGDPGLARRSDDRARGLARPRDLRALRPRQAGPFPHPAPRPAPPDAAIDPQHLPAQGPAGAHPGRAGAGRHGVHDRVHGARLALRDPRRHRPLLQLRRPGGADRAHQGGDVVAEALAVPGVTVAEPWRFASAQRIRPDGSESPARVTFGLPDGATTVRPVVMEGRWLLPGEGNALVATANLLGDEPDLGVGDEVTLRIGGRDTTWTLVGIVQSPTMAPFLYVGTRRRSSGASATRAGSGS